MAITVRVKRKPQDATLRNVKASRRRDADLEKRLRRLERLVGRIQWKLRTAGIRVR